MSHAWHASIVLARPVLHLLCVCVFTGQGQGRHGAASAVCLCVHGPRPRPPRCCICCVFVCPQAKAKATTTTTKKEEQPKVEVKADSKALATSTGSSDSQAKAQANAGVSDSLDTGCTVYCVLYCSAPSHRVQTLQATMTLPSKHASFVDRCNQWHFVSVPRTLSWKEEPSGMARDHPVLLCSLVLARPVASSCRTFKCAASPAASIPNHQPWL
jgi:hypothetical protein